MHHIGIEARRPCAASISALSYPPGSMPGMSLAPPVQRSFDDLGTALVDQTFVVFDLETTGGSPRASRITEIGAVKVRGGEVLGEFRSLVNPGVPIPAGISALTGITDEMVWGAPPIESLLPAFLEFCGDAVWVAHNAGFDTGFVRAACASLGYVQPRNRIVCTVRLARRLVRDEVPNLRLETLAHALRARTAPCHRALDDARATTDVFHALLELAGRWGISHTEDLLWFQSTRGHPSYRKVGVLDGLPRARGVYLFREASGRVLYVGKATDLRTRVRSYFGDDRRHIDDLLRAMERVDHVLCATDLDASVLEARLIRLHRPPFNRAQRGRAAAWFLRLTTDRFPRLSRSATPGGLGPLPARALDVVREALEEGSEIRTCTIPITRTTQRAPCVRGQIDRCPAPCTGAPVTYEPAVTPVAAALSGDPSAVLSLLESRISSLSANQRYEEAASARDRVGALVDAVRTARAVGALRRAGRAVLSIDGHVVVLSTGALESVDGSGMAVPSDGHHDESRLIAAWLARHARKVRLRACEGDWSQPVLGGAPLAHWGARLKALARLSR